MEKTLTIDGRQVRFKSNAATPIYYRTQFGTDYFGELMSLGEIAQAIQAPLDSDTEEDEIDINHIDFKKMANFNSQVFYQIVWVLAKTADKNTPPLLDWLETFEEFEIFDVFSELQDMVMKSMSSKKK